tara:strand:- start:38906 stop:39748 length:843 start_codon:yes stop_codon:yes gene_type:complete
MKNFIKPLLSGIVVAIIMVGIMLKVTMDFQINIIAGIILFLIAGFYNSRSNLPFAVSSILLVLPYAVLFLLLIYPELPSLVYMLILFLISAVLGVLFYKHKKLVVVGLAIFGALTFWFVTKHVPTAITNDLTFVKNEAVPNFILNDVNQGEISSSSLKGNVVVLDFFGTWCKPCILELKELDKIQKNLNEEDVVFYVVDADLGGDTLEKFKSFFEKESYNFNYAYDYNSELFKSFNLQSTGLPTLLILDKDHNLRFHHIGFNPAETNFEQEITTFIRSIL